MEQFNKFIKELRSKGIKISDKEVNEVYMFCCRKMEFTKVGNKAEYNMLMFEDEIKNYLIRRNINITTIFRKIREEIA